jgi:hypothetical protein
MRQVSITTEINLLMSTKYLLLTVLLLAPMMAVYLPAQCHPDSLEIPNNGIDEDCDGLDDLYLKLAPYFYAVEGVPFSVHYPNLILSKHPGDYLFEVITDMNGQVQGDRWEWSANDPAGSYLFAVRVKNPQGTILATDTMTVRIAPAAMPTDTASKKLWLLGHSFFNQGYLPLRLWNLVQDGNNPPITFHGSQPTWGVYDQIRHEGRGGYTASLYVNSADSPLFLNNKKVNLRAYFDQWMGTGQTPDWVVYHLDINDFCGYTGLVGTTLEEIDDTIISTWETYGYRIIDSIRAVAPNAKIGICVSPPAHGLESAFAASFGNNNVLNSRWRWQKIISRLAHLNETVYGNREDENIYLIPEFIDLDDTLAYNAWDAIHPDRGGCGGGPPYCGYYHIGNQIYAWMRYMAFLPEAPQAPEPIMVAAKAFLQGPFVRSTEMMHDSLRVQNRIPLLEPYSSMSNFTHIGGGGEQTTNTVLGVSDSNAVVDWVFLELRHAGNPEQVVATRSALLQRDGDVVDVDGSSPIAFDASVDTGNYYLALRHRNHLGVQLGTTRYFETGSVETVDFTALPNADAYAFNAQNTAQRLQGGYTMLWAGNGRTDYQLKYNGSNNDRNAILSVVGINTPHNVVPGYHNTDYNMDGLVKYNGSNNDRNVLLGNVGINTPSKIIYDQVAQ